MELEFEDHYVIAVIALLWGLCFCRNILDSFSTLVRLADSCIESNLCCLKSLVECYNSSRFGEVLRQSTVLFCFFQPAIFCAIFVFNKSRVLPPASSVVLHNVQLNSSSISYRHANLSHVLQVEVVQWNLIEIDYLLIVMPFAVLVSTTSLLWVHCINIRDITDSTTWDAQMPESVFFYETMYYIELWAMNLSFIAVAASERSILEIHYAAMALSGMLIFSVSQAKFDAEQSTVQHTISLLVTLCYFCILVPLWLEMVQTKCIVALAMAVTHAFILLILSTVHSMARGNFQASWILLVRITCTVTACLAHMCVYASGRNDKC